MPPEQTTSWLLRLRQTMKARRQQRALRRQQEPWILRRCPKSIRKIVEFALMCIGGLAACIFGFAFLAGLYIGPFLLAQSHSDSSAAVFMRWYLHLIRSHFSEASFSPAFFMIQCGVAFILMYFIRILIWITKTKDNEIAERDKSDVA